MVTGKFANESGVTWLNRDFDVLFFVCVCVCMCESMPWPSTNPAKSEFSQVLACWSTFGAERGSRCLRTISQWYTQKRTHFWVKVVIAWVPSTPQISEVGILGMIGYTGRSSWRLFFQFATGVWGKCRIETLIHLQIVGVNVSIVYGPILGLSGVFLVPGRFAKQQIPLGPWMKRSVPRLSFGKGKSLYGNQGPNGSWPFLFLWCSGLEWLSWLMTT